MIQVDTSVWVEHLRQCLPRLATLLQGGDVLIHLLQDVDAPLAVLDQVVVGGEDGGDAFLDREWEDIYLHLIEDCWDKECR